MREFFERIANQFRDIWGKFNQNQKIATVAVVGLILLVSLGLAFWTIRPSYSVLFSNLTQEDAATIVEKLREEGVPYQLAGNAVEVPTDQVYDLRLRLAGQGLPQSGGIGFEIFDKAGFGQTDFTQNVNFKRALEGELSRTITQLEQIESARVHIVMPKPSLFTDKEKDATASVLLKLKSSTELDEGQVQGIVHLVNKSVEGLKSKNVTVVDTRGNILTADSGDTNTKLTMSQLELKQAYEKQLQTGLERMLGTVVGPNKSTVKVDAEMDFTETTTDSKIFEGEPIVRSEQSSQEKFEGAGTSNPAAGVAGTATNIPGFNFNAATGAQNNNYKKNETTINNEITEHIKKQVVPPGNVKRLSVAILVDANQATIPQLSAINQAVAAASGINLTRGDQLFVQALPFDKSAEREEQKQLQADRQTELYNTLAKVLVLIVLVGLAIFIVRRMLQSQPMVVPQTGYPAAFEELQPAVIPEMLPTAQSAEESKRKQIYEHVEQMAKEKPDEVARLLERWLSAD